MVSKHSNQAEREYEETNVKANSKVQKSNATESTVHTEMSFQSPYFPFPVTVFIAELPGKCPLIFQLIWPQRAFSQLIDVVTWTDFLALFEIV